MPTSPTSDLLDPVAHFRALGFVVLRGALQPFDFAALSAEADRVVRDAVGDRYLVRHDDAGIDGHYIPATGALTPVSLALAAHFAPLAAELLGVAVLLALAQHIVFFDAANWHTDTGHHTPSVKVAAYLDRLDESNGALRVLPASHLVDEQRMRAFMQRDAFVDEVRWRDAVRAVPCHVIASQPGDVIVFDEHLWHASIDGHDRRQWCATYVLDPGDDTASEAEVSRYLASQFSANTTLDHDPSRYPNYGQHFRRVAPCRWVEPLERLGAFAAAAAEEHGGST